MYQMAAPPDPYVLNDTLALTANNYRKTTGLTPSLFTPNPAQKTLALIVAGQSNWTNVTPTLYTPNASALQLNVYDGAIYAIADKMLGNSDEGSSFGPGNISARVADKLLIANGGTFDKVVVANIAIGGTAVSDWGSSGTLYDRSIVAMRRFAQNGMTPGATGVSFAFLWGQGEQDTGLGTGTSAYQTALSGIISHLQSAGGFTGRFFICKETWSGGTTSSNVQTAQINVIDNVTIFSGGNLDSLNATNRYADNTHFNDTGAPAAATLVFNAMHASGAPY